MHNGARRASHRVDSQRVSLAGISDASPLPGAYRTHIVDSVWRADLEAFSNVVDICIHYLCDKIDQGFAHPLIKTVRGVGYKIEA